MNCITLKLENLNQHKFLCGDVYWVKKSGKKVLISSAGEFLNQEFIEKLISRNEKIELNPSIDIDQSLEFQKIFKDLKNCELESEKVVSRELFLNLIYKNADESHLMLAHSMFNVFYELSGERKEIYLKNNSELLGRLLSIASVLVSEAFLNGFLDFNFLKSTYNTILLSDIYLAQKHVNVNTPELFKDEFKIHRKKAVEFLGASKNRSIEENLLDFSVPASDVFYNDIVRLRQVSEKLFSMNLSEYINLKIHSCISLQFKEAA